MKEGVQTAASPARAGEGAVTGPGMEGTRRTPALFQNSRSSAAHR